MIRRLALIGLVATLFASPAHAQRGRGRTGPVVSPFGTLYNTRSPEYRASGGNPLILDQLLQQKMIRQQQELYLREQKAAAKSQAGIKKTNNARGSITTLPGQTPGNADPSFNPFINPPPRKKKRKVTPPITASRPAETPKTTVAKPSKPAPGASKPDPSKTPTVSAGTSTKPR